MKESQGFTYQIYETYLQQGKEAYGRGCMEEAKTMYYHAAQALLRSAKNNDGETKEALVRRAQKLIHLADRIPSEDASKRKNCETKPEHLSQGMVSGNKAEEPEEKIWKRSGNPGVYFDDIAGLSEAKESIQVRVILPRKHPDVYRYFRREVEGGILLYGPPGTGKTMLAKALATELDAAFYSIRCSDIMAKYFGESEQNIKELFREARNQEYAIIFFDEFEAFAANRGGDSSVMNRLVAELLTQMDGFQEEKKNNLLVVAATNRPWDIDSAFLRPPRLTEKIYIGLPDYEARLFLASRAFEGVPSEIGNIGEEIAARTEGYSAADVTAVCGRIKDQAIRYVIDQNKTEGAIRAEDINKVLTESHSSVQKSDLNAIRRWEDAQKK